MGAIDLAPQSIVAYHLGTRFKYYDWRRFMRLLLMGSLALRSYALTQVDIFSAEVAINAEDKQPEQVARNTGMEQVLIRATGQPMSLRMRRFKRRCVKVRSICLK